jgi:hypothetical protein
MLDKLHSLRCQGFGGGFYEEEEYKSAADPAYAGNNMD